MLRFTKSNWLTSLLMMVMFVMVGSAFAQESKTVTFDWTSESCRAQIGLGTYGTGLLTTSSYDLKPDQAAILNGVQMYGTGSYTTKGGYDATVGRMKISSGDTFTVESTEEGWKIAKVVMAASGTSLSLSGTNVATGMLDSQLSAQWPATMDESYALQDAEADPQQFVQFVASATSYVGVVTVTLVKEGGPTPPAEPEGYTYKFTLGTDDAEKAYGALEVTEGDVTATGNYIAETEKGAYVANSRFGSPNKLTLHSDKGNIVKVVYAGLRGLKDEDSEFGGPNWAISNILSYASVTDATGAEVGTFDKDTYTWEGSSSDVVLATSDYNLGFYVEKVYVWIEEVEQEPEGYTCKFTLGTDDAEQAYGAISMTEGDVTATGKYIAETEKGAYIVTGRFASGTSKLTLHSDKGNIVKVVYAGLRGLKDEDSEFGGPDWAISNILSYASVTDATGAEIGTFDKDTYTWEGSSSDVVLATSNMTFGFYVEKVYVWIEEVEQEPEGYTCKFTLGTDDAEQAYGAISMTEGDVTATGKYIAETEKGAYIVTGRFASGTSKLTLHSDKGNIVKVVYAGLRGLKDEDSEFGGPDWAISNILSYASVTDATGAEIGTFDKDTYTWEGSSSDVVLATSNMTFGFYVEKVYVWIEEGEQEPEGYDYKFVFANPDAKKGSPATFGGENDITVDCYYGGKPEVGALVNGYNSGNFRIIVHGVEGKNITKIQLAGVSQNNPKNELTTVLADLSSTPAGLDSLTWKGNAPEVTIWLNSMLGLNVEKIYIWCGAPALDLGADYVFDLADATNMTQDGITVTAAKSGNYNLTPNAGPTVSADRNIRKIYLEGTEDIASDVVSALKNMMYWKAVPTWYPEDNMWKGNTNKVGFHTNTKSGFVTRVHVWADPKDEAQTDDQTVYLASLTEDLEPYRVEVPTATETAYSLVEDQSDMGCPKRLNQGAYTVTLRKANTEGNYRIVYCGYQLDAEANFVAEGALFTVDGKLVRDAEGNAKYYIFTKDDEEYDIANGNSVYSFEDIRETYDNLDREAVAEADAELLQQIDEAIASIADFRVFKDDYLEFSKPISALLDKAKVLKAGTTLWDGVLPFHGYIVSAQQDRTWYMWSKDGVLEFDNKYAETEEADRAKYVIDIYEVDGKVVMQASDGMYVEQVYDQTFIDDDAELGPNEPVHMTDDVTKAADFSVVRATDVSESWDPLRYIIRNMSAIANADGKSPAVLYLEAFWDYNISAMNISGKIYGSTEDTKDAFYFYQLPAPAVKPEFVSSDAPAEPVKSLSTITVTYTEEVQIANAAGVGLYKDGVDEALLNNITMTVNPDDAHQVIITIDDAESLVSMDGAVAYTLEIADGAIANAADADVTADGVAIHFTIYDETVGINGLGFDGKNGNLFNTAGQRVRKNTKGVLIREGVKVIRK